MMAAMAADPPWHALPIGEVIEELQVDPGCGLSAAEVDRRRRQHGANEIAEQRQRPPWRMFLGQFTDFMILVLIAAAAISGAVGEVIDAVAIIVIVVLNGVIGFVQEYRAERAVAALKRMAAPTASVHRDGAPRTVAAADLVPGDIVLLAAGNIVPADLRLLEAVRLDIDEAALTGESVPVSKSTEPLEARDLPLGDRTCMAYKGSVVAAGRGTGIVIATGMRTELGRIATLLREAGDGRTPLQRRLASFGRRLAVGALFICAIVFAMGIARGEDAVLMFLTAVSLAVAAIPEALPAVITVSLALGARRMVAENALVRRLPAVETLGSVTYICSDKTGTLTENRMRVEQLLAGAELEELRSEGMGPQQWPLLYRGLALSNDVVRGADGHLRGDPTEIALCAAAEEAGCGKETLEASMPRLGEVPFDSQRKLMTTLHADGDAVVAFTKGAPEAVLRQCGRALGQGGEVAVDRPALLERAEQMAAAGLRVLAMAAARRSRAAGDTADVEDDLIFLGLVGLLDPPRPEAAEAVAMCRSAGITPVMITGDHPATARAIAERLGIAAADAEVIGGAELARISEEELQRRSATARVYARVAPEQKIAIVEALQRSQQFVAMTGDGVNDAPALKRADIGIAMGQTGTDVAREAADMILLDDNFATIVVAVREGRRVFDNARKFIRYAVTCNSGEIWTIFLAPLFGLPMPLLPVQILWINLVTDGLPGLALAMEPAERTIMQRPPRPPQEGIFTGMLPHILGIGLLMAAVTLATQAGALRAGLAEWQTMVFTVLSLLQMGQVMAIRSEKESLLELGLWSNPALLGAVALTALLQLAIIYVPGAAVVFKTQPLGAGELILCLALSSVTFFAVELGKWWTRRRRRRHSA